MAEPIIPQKEPMCLELNTGKKYFWCSCGESEKQPFCDGKHKASDNFKPLAFEVEDQKDYWLCACKKTKNAPFCDGTHYSL